MQNLVKLGGCKRLFLSTECLRAANAKQAQEAYAESMQPKAKTFQERSFGGDSRESRSRQPEMKPGDPLFP